MSDTRPQQSAPDADTLERSRINSETAKIAWKELQRFFAQGHAIAVANHLDLVEVAYQFSQDNKDLAEEWMQAGHVRPVSDAQAAEWLEADALVWAVIVRPWVLVQPVLQNSER